jgi:ferric-dicitrate binding protein FerR (iron transport regulator)
VRQLRDELLADAFREPDLDHCALQAELADEEVQLLRASSRRRWFTVAAGLAASLLVAASIFTAAYFATRPTIVAQLTQANHCQWAAASNPPAVGSLLHAGQTLKLNSGQAMLTFASGAKMHLVGPATVQLVSPSAAELSAGRVGAQVPTQAIGFTVATPIARFVDLGTEFSVSLEPTNSCELQVFDGLVEMRLPQHADRAAEQLRISEGSAVRFDAGTFDVHSIPYDEEQRIAP